MHNSSNLLDNFGFLFGCKLPSLGAKFSTLRRGHLEEVRLVAADLLRDEGGQGLGLGGALPWLPR